MKYTKKINNFKDLKEVYSKKDKEEYGKPVFIIKKKVDEIKRWSKLFKHNSTKYSIFNRLLSIFG